MKIVKIIGSLLVGASLLALVMYARKDAQIQIVYDESIDKLPIKTLKNLRYVSSQEKQELFESFTNEHRFSIDKICKKIDSIKNPQIILWFADHFGTIKTEGLRWYKENVFCACKPDNAVYWLADLAAWRYLAIKETELSNCPDFTQKNKAFFDFNTCPLLREKSEIALQGIKNLAHFELVTSADFFAWLASLPFSIDIIMAKTAQNLVRTDLRAGAARFSLRQIGYTILFLDTWSEKLNTNLLDADHTQLFPLLQYLEGIYYVLQICKKSELQECNIVFLLPNKEFTYYVTDNDRVLFDSFKKDVSRFIQQQEKNDSKVTLYFFPFSFGQDFYDQPFELPGSDIQTQEELLHLLRT